MLSSRNKHRSPNARHALKKWAHQQHISVWRAHCSYSVNRARLSTWSNLDSNTTSSANITKRESLTESNNSSVISTSKISHFIATLTRWQSAMSVFRSNPSRIITSRQVKPYRMKATTLNRWERFLSKLIKKERVYKRIFSSRWKSCKRR